MRLRTLAGFVLVAIVAMCFATGRAEAAPAAEGYHLDPALMEAAVAEVTALGGADFRTAYNAALSRDPEALPVLVAFLRERTESTLTAGQSVDKPMEQPIEMEWPVALDFVWGAYGPEGYPVLCQIAAESGDPVMVESALSALCTSEYPDALPVARRLAIEGETAGVRRAAVRLLGWHGRARDWERLLLGLMSDDVDEITASLWAIHKSGDPRVVSYAIPFCDHPDPWVRDEALSVLALACTPESIEAMHRVCDQRSEDPGLDEFAFYTDAVLWIAGLDRATYCVLAPADREQAVARAKAILYGPRPGAAPISRVEALAMVAQWTEDGCISCDALDDVEHLIAAALVRDDIPLLQELRASIYRRLSDQALRDVAKVESIMQKVVRRDLAGKGP